VIVLGPPVLFPLVPTPWAFLLLAPLVLLLTTPIRAEIARLVTLIRSSMSRKGMEPVDEAMAGPTP